MAEIKIYKITCTRAVMMDEQGEGYSLYPWGDDTCSYEGYDDGGEMYVLPAGYKVGRSQYGEKAKQKKVVKSKWSDFVGVYDDDRQLHKYNVSQ